LSVPIQETRLAKSLAARAGSGRVARHAGFWWGFAEGLFFFIVPDVYITCATLFSARAGAIAWMASIAGSTAAVAVLYGLVALPGVDYLAFLENVPGVSARLLERVGRGMTGEGLPYTPLLALGGVPLKVYAGVAFSRGLSLASVLLWTVFARFVRIAPGYVAVAAVRLLWRRRIAARPVAWCVALGLVWIAFYIFYFVHMSRV
jgi:hypothetical protein